MPRMLFATACVSLLSLTAVPSALSAFSPPPNDGFVTDVADIFSDEDEAALETMLQEYQRSTSNEIAVLTVKTLQDEPIADTAISIGRSWGVGGEQDNGILLLIAYDDQEMFMAVGYGLEGAVPDIVAHGIIQKDIVPAFRDGSYAEGVKAAVLSLQKHIGGEFTSDRYDQNGTSGGQAPWIFFLLFIGFDFLSALLARTKSWWMGGIAGGVFGIILTYLFSWWISIPVLVLLGLFFDYVVSKAGPRRFNGRRGGPYGGFGGGRGGRGGFGGFGGGSFGGGGASGRW